MPVDARQLGRRLEPVILELEREPADILFIGHGSVIRCIMAYLQGLTPNEIPKVELRRGDIVQVTPSACALLLLLLSLSLPDTLLLSRAIADLLGHVDRWRQVCQPLFLAMRWGMSSARSVRFPLSLSPPPSRSENVSIHTQSSHPCIVFLACNALELVRARFPSSREKGFW